MTYLLIAPALWLLFLLAAPVSKGRSASHTAIGITVPSAAVLPDGNVTAFVLIQERGEWRLHKLLAIAAALAFLLLPFGLMTVFFQVIVMIAVDQFTRNIEAIDFAGHGAKIMAAEAAGKMEYREAEIARMMKDRNKRGDDIPAQLARWNWLARIVFWLGRA